MKRKAWSLNHPMGSHLLPRNVPLDCYVCGWEINYCFGIYLQTYIIQSLFLVFASTPFGLEAGLCWVDFEPGAYFCWHSYQVWWHFDSFLVSSLVPNTFQLLLDDVALPTCASLPPLGSWSLGKEDCLTPDTVSWLHPFWTFILSLKSCLFNIPTKYLSAFGLIV